jgi:hypothetical protein
MKLLKFKQHPNKVVTISNRGNTEIGSIHPRGEVFKKSIIFLSFTDLTEWTSDCLREVADFMDSQQEERRKTVRPKRAVQQRKGKICPEYKACVIIGGFTGVIPNCKKCTKNTGRLSPVA